jgi:hypothetical protein
LNFNEVNDRAKAQKNSSYHRCHWKLGENNLMQAASF